MDTKSKAERLLKDPTIRLNNQDVFLSDVAELKTDVKEVAQAYLTQCQEVDRLKAQPTPCACLINDDDEYDRRCAFHRDKEQEARNNALEDAAKACLGATYINNGSNAAEIIREMKDKQ